MKAFLAITALFFSLACSASRSATSPAPSTTNTPPIAAASIASSSPPLQDKPKCTLRISQAPTIKGLKLGMTADEVLASFPGSKDDPEVRSQLSANQFGSSNFLIKPSKYESREKFTEISQISLSLLDGRVWKMHVGFDGPEWPHVDKFVEKFVDGTSLSAVDQWQPYVGLDNQLKTLTCVDFEVRVFAGGTGGNINYILLQDLEADKELKERRRKARQQASPTPQ